MEKRRGKGKPRNTNRELMDMDNWWGIDCGGEQGRSMGKKEGQL